MGRDARGDLFWHAVGTVIESTIGFVWWVAVTATTRLEAMIPGLSIVYWLAVIGAAHWGAWGLTRSRRLFSSGEDVAAYSGRAGWVPRPVRTLVQGQQVAGGVVALGGVVAAGLVVPVTLALAFLPVMPAVILGWVALRLRRARRHAWW